MPQRSAGVAVAAALAVATILVVDGIVALVSEHNAASVALAVHPRARVTGTNGYNALVAGELAFATLYLVLAFMLRTRERTAAWLILGLLSVLGMTGVARPNATNIALATASAAALVAMVIYYRNRRGRTRATAA